MGLKKGQTNNPRGRKKGTPNYTTQEIRKTIKSALENEFSNISNLLGTLSPKDRIEMIVKLLPFVIPKCEESEEENSVNRCVVILPAKDHSPDYSLRNNNTENED